MALSGSISTTFYDNQFTLSVEWTATQNIANNTSTVTAKMYLKSNGSLYLGSSSCTARARIDGQWYGGAFNPALSAGQKKLIHTAVRTLTHNATTGQKSFTLIGEILLVAGVDVISPSSGVVGRLSLTYTTPSKTFTLNTIPRGSTLSSFSVANHLKPNTSNTVNLSITRQSSSYTHDIQLRDGSTVLQTWTGQGTPSTLTIDSSTVNTLLSRMSHVTSRTLTLRVQTKSGSSNIGSAVSRTATATVDSSVKPTLTNLTASIAGSGHDKSINKYVQNISKVSASFSASATGGATINSRRMILRRRSDNADSQVALTSSTTFPNPVALSGTYEVWAEVTDSRGRTNSTSVSFTVQEYKTPMISSFQASRLSDTPTIVNLIMKGSWHALGGDNTLNIHVQKRLVSALPSGSWSTVETTTGVTGTMNNTVNSANNDITKSYTYRLTITDQFGKAVTATTSVSTQKVVLDIHKDEGVGIGKLHEKGALDIAGDVYLNGYNLFRNIPIQSGTDLNDIKTPGLYGSSNDSIGRSLLNRPSGASPLFTLEVFPNYTISEDNPSVVQRLTSLGGAVYIRTYTLYQTTDGWSPWYKFEMVEV